MVEFVDFGQRGYRETWDYQEQLLDTLIHAKLQGQTVTGQLIFVEHLPVYTIGKSGNAANMLLNPMQLAEKHVECIKVDRGGGHYLSWSRPVGGLSHYRPRPIGNRR